LPLKIYGEDGRKQGIFHIFLSPCETDIKRSPKEVVGISYLFLIFNLKKMEKEF
jgi:hypothetical protein